VVVETGELERKKLTKIHPPRFPLLPSLPLCYFDLRKLVSHGPAKLAVLTPFVRGGLACSVGEGSGRAWQAERG
jgi:hypothetical protein